MTVGELLDVIESRKDITRDTVIMCNGQCGFEPDRFLLDKDENVLVLVDKSESSLYGVGDYFFDKDFDDFEIIEGK